MWKAAREATGGKGQEQVQDWDGLWEAVLSFTSASTLSWRLKSSAGLLNLSLESPEDWRNYVCLVLCAR